MKWATNFRWGKNGPYLGENFLLIFLVVATIIVAFAAVQQPFNEIVNTLKRMKICHNDLKR